jgi:hypothetical protein
MRAIRTKEGQARNPVFSVADKRKASATGEVYAVPEFITLPVGGEIDHPDAWRLCVKGVAVADDDECRKKFLDYIGAPGRLAIVEEIKLLRQAAANTTLTEQERRHKEALEKAYAVDLMIDEQRSQKGGKNAVSRLGQGAGKSTERSGEDGSGGTGSGTESPNAAVSNQDSASVPSRDGVAD